MSENVYEGPVLEYQDFFSPFVSYEEFILPDGIQTIKFKIMSEGDRIKYQQKTTRPIQLDRKTDMAQMRPDIANDRQYLIENSVVDWTLRQKTPDGEWIPVIFNTAMLRNWLLGANPKIISDLETAIQKANPWMQADMSVEDIQSEIDRLNDLLDQKKKEESEKNS